MHSQLTLAQKLQNLNELRDFRKRENNGKL